MTRYHRMNSLNNRHLFSHRPRTRNLRGFQHGGISLLDLLPWSFSSVWASDPFHTTNSMTFRLDPTLVKSFELSDLLKARFLSLVTLRFRTWVYEFGGGYCPVLSTWERKGTSLYFCFLNSQKFMIWRGVHSSSGSWFRRRQLCLAPSAAS